MNQFFKTAKNGGFGKIIGNFNRLLETLSAGLLLLILSMTCVDVIGRYFLNSPLQGATELTELGIAAVVFLVFPTVCYERRHVSIDIMDPYFPKRFAFLRDGLTNLLIGGSLFYLSFEIFKLASRSSKREETSEILDLPVSPLFQAIGVLCLLGGVSALLGIFFPAKTEKNQKLS